MHLDIDRISCNEPQNSIEERALRMTLPTTNKEIIKEAQEISRNASKKVRECKYAESLEIIYSGLQQFPDNFLLQSDFASLLGDHGENFVGDLKIRMQKRSKELFAKLMNEVEGQPKEETYDFKNEYYYRFAQYKNQYELGQARVVDYWRTPQWIIERGYVGYYSQGVGATYYARELILEGNKQQAFNYAHKAIVAWAQYFAFKNDYYNSYVHYALALGILGFKEEMMRALEHSASLINKDLNYHEFKEVIDFIEQLR